MVDDPLALTANGCPALLQASVCRAAQPHLNLVVDGDDIGAYLTYIFFDGDVLRVGAVALQSVAVDKAHDQPDRVSLVAVT